MHISLDSALGRQRRLNSVGESVLQIAPDAAAAYSLRSLTGGDPDVVRVRRESDNTEKDFSGSQIESGEMARWVNEQPTLPLDLRELDTNTGERDGALIQAAAAYSLRKLKDDFTGDVVEVRRSSDDATQSFTAAEVADGKLESWVGAGNDGHVKTWYDQSGNTNDAVQTDAAKQPKIVEGGTLKDHLDFDGDVFMDIGEFLMDGTDASTVMVMSNVDTDVETFYLSNRSGAGGFNFKNDTSNKGKLQYSYIGSGSSTTSNVFVADNTDAKFITTITKDSNDREFFGNGSQLADDGASNTYTQATGTPNTSIGKQGNSSAAAANKKLRVYEIISYDLELGDNRTAIEANIGETYGITDIPAADDTVNGYVQTWYDQSGEGNDAEQIAADKQPKIVDGGVLVSGGILSDGAGTFLEFDSTLSITDEFDIFFTGTATASNWTTLQRSPYGFSTNSDYPRFNDDSYRYTINGTDSGLTNYNSGFTIGADTPFIYNFNRNSSDSVGCQINGTAQTNRATLSGTHKISQLFRRGTNTTQIWDGTMSEMIFYDSDQTANRPAIETNIANQYGITLSY